MDYNNLPQEIFNAEQDNLQKLAALFPAAVKDGLLDIAALKEELGQFEEVTAERYELNWAGKRNAKKASQSDVAGRTLKYIPEDSKDADTTQNLYIEGDNLEVLKLLRQNYYGAVKMIYIDPPYNTGNDFVYRDDFSQSKAASDEAEGETVDGERMVVNQKSGNRFHANWLNMMYPRLRVAKDLLREDGVIFISINDKELSSLTKICNEIFHENNFIATLIWDRNHSAQAGIYKVYHEYVLVYAKQVELIGRPTSLDNDLFEAGAMKKASGRHSLQPFTFPKGTRFDAPDGIELSGEWGDVEKVKLISGRMIAKEGTLSEDVTLEAAYTQISQMHTYFYGDKEKLVDSQGQKILEFYLSSTGKVKVVKQRSVETPQTTCKFGAQGPVSIELAELFGLDDSPFSSPKPISMMLDFILRFTDNDDLILDFFSGSATTAHAVFEAAKRGEKRKFILVQYPENLDTSLTSAQKDAVRTLETAITMLSNLGKPHYITEIGKERIRRAGDKIKAEVEAANAQNKTGEAPKQVPDIGFRVFRTADTNIRWTHEALKPGQVDMDESMLSDKDKLDFMPGHTDIDVVYEVLLRQRDIPLSAKVEKLDIGQRTYLFADAYVVCLDETVTVELAEALAAVEPTPIKYVFRDSAFEDNISLKDETVRRLEAYIARNSGEQKKAYTVEFI